MQARPISANLGRRFAGRGAESGGSPASPFSSVTLSSAQAGWCSRPKARFKTRREGSDAGALAGGFLAQHASLPPLRNGLPAADHPHLHGMVLSGLPRKGARRYRLSLKRSAWPRSLRSGLLAEPRRPAETRRREPDSRFEPIGVTLRSGGGEERGHITGDGQERFAATS
jgi:hypothetical protein